MAGYTVISNAGVNKKEPKINLSALKAREI